MPPVLQLIAIAITVLTVVAETLASTKK